MAFVPIVILQANDWNSNFANAKQGLAWFMKAAIARPCVTRNFNQSEKTLTPKILLFELLKR